MKYFSFLLFLLFISCNKDNDPSIEDQNPVYFDPVSRGKGMSQGAGVTKVLGSSGGVLELGKEILIEVPAGAVEEQTLFGIEPISNTHDTTAGRHAYRLSPEGVTFKKPVKITFKRDPVDTDNPQSRRIAFQRTDGVWSGVSTALDNDTKHISTTTTHFSDWVWFDQVTLRKDKDVVGGGGQVKLKLMEQLLAALESNSDIDNVPLAALEDIGRSKDLVVKGWKIISGPGEITPKINSNMVRGDAIYYAPPIVTRTEEVEIQVEVESKKGYVADPNAPNGRRKFGKMILVTKVRLEKEMYFTVNVGGKVVDLSARLNGGITGGQITVGSMDESGDHQVTLFCYGAKEGTYPGGSGMGQSFLGISLVENGKKTMYNNLYLDCNGVYRASGTTINSSVAGYITGTFSGPVFYSNKGCGVTDQKEVRIDFKFKSP